MKRIHISLMAAAGLAVAVAMAMAAGAQASSGNDVYTVAGIAVFSEAADAVSAKKAAMEEGQREALRRLLIRLTPFKVHNRLPQLGQAHIDQLLDGFEVREEAYSSTQYKAKLDFNFKPKAIRELLNSFGLPFTDERSSVITVAPVLQSAAAESSGAVWRQSWTALDLKHALTPVKLADLRAIGVLAAVQASQNLPPDTLERLKYKLGAEYAVLAVGAIDETAGIFEVILSGEDAVGQFSLRQGFRIYDGDVREAAKRAAQVTHGVLEARWKLARLASQGALEGPADPEQVEFVAVFSGLGEWQKIRKKIEALPGVQEFEVKALFAGGARIVLAFPGGLERFRKVAFSQGFSLDQDRGIWILRRR